MSLTPISKIILEGREFLVKRDDLYDTFLSGNKFRKLYLLLESPKEKYNKIISYGGTQSNAMLAIAAMCNKKGWEFEYYSKPISKTQEEANTGNLYLAKQLGIKHIQIQDELYRDTIEKICLNFDEKTFIVHQGGADKVAKGGLKSLANEITEQDPDVKALATPSGTGTTALFLALNLPDYIVYTTPCVGDVEYLKTQMLSLVKELPKNLVILKPKKKYHFAKPYIEFYEMYKKLLEAGIEFDLLYAPAMWKALIEQTYEKVMYIHSGGVSGNSTMLQRYEKKFR